ncbi:putative E3 ubiquitin-protein ligase sinah [Zootermopsis nevadensis]|uniref:RING-type E3 ubiquitin transferase n=1 Tax=Zootermopsis nevadensis TaxID=136037 RepID=A0A067QP20_ZOONE|nr:putative E3 ubiquitin-protein ligase sinah [Zootermopsis nevadensis]
MEDLNQGLLSVLECMHCRQYMLPPIVSCENGHHVCNDCRAFLATCLVCYRPYLNIRNSLLENLARTSVFPCDKQPYGCKEIVPMDGVMDHQRTCPYSNYTRCPYAVLPTQICTWQGPLTDVRCHIHKYHEINICDVGGKFVSNLPHLRQNRGLSHQVIFTLNELFFCLWEMVEHDFCFSVFYIGPNFKARYFKYNLTVCTTLGQEAYSRNCCRIRNLDERNDCSRVSDYVMIPFSRIRRVLHLSERNQLQYSVDIFNASVVRVQ